MLGVKLPLSLHFGGRGNEAERASAKLSVVREGDKLG